MRAQTRLNQAGSHAAGRWVTPGPETAPSKVHLSSATRVLRKCDLDAGVRCVPLE